MSTCLCDDNVERALSRAESHVTTKNRLFLVSFPCTLGVESGDKSD